MSTCSNGGRKGFVPGSLGHFAEDAQTFADWGVDYVKLDWCVASNVTKGLNITALNVLRKNRTDQMRAAMNSTGRPMWLTFHCVYKKGEANVTGTGSFQEWCAEDGNSWRIGRSKQTNKQPPSQPRWLLENTDGRVLRPPPPSVFSRGGSLLPFIYADARCIDAVVVSQAPIITTTSPT